MRRYMLQDFKSVIQSGVDPMKSDDTVAAKDGTYKAIYVPFEYVNKSAKLAIVGITPGPNQIAAAYAQTRNLLLRDLPEADVLREAIKAGAFKGGMRDNLITILKHFDLARRLGIEDEATLWTSSAGLLHSTSVVPHAAFKRGQCFNGPFSEVMRSRLLREIFETCFVPTLSELSAECRFLALGATPLDALKWCADRRIIARDQILGACPHPSPSSGNQVKYFVRAITAADISPLNPVRKRLTRLDTFYTGLKASIEAWAPVH
jgi:hypothetical protein